MAADIAPKGTAKFQRFVGIVDRIGRGEFARPSVGRAGSGIGCALAVVVFIAPIGILRIEVEIVGVVSCGFGSGHPFPAPVGVAIGELGRQVMVGGVLRSGTGVEHHGAGQAAMVGGIGGVGRELCGRGVTPPA